MVDIHCHILPEIDDGAKDFATAEQMLKAAAENGVDTIFCTPHYSEAALAAIPSRLTELQAAAASVGIRLLPGMEYAYRNFPMESTQLRPLGESSFLLIELNCPTLPPAIHDFFFALARRGYQVIIAHPERYLTELHDCVELAGLGVFFQLNADSILGHNGADRRRMAERMLRSGHCHYIASDAHGVRRKCRLRECRKRIESRFGALFAEVVFERNPQRLLRNLSPETPKARKGWLARLFGR